MTPDKARGLLHDAAPGKWQWDVTGNVAAVDGDGWEDVADYVSESNAPLIAAAPVLASMIAGMHEEWGVHVTGYPKNIADWAELCDSPEDHITWLPDEEAAENFAVEREDDGYDTRIVRRYVTEPEEA